MSDQITTAMIHQFKAGIEHIAQQEGSAMRSHVRVEQQVGKSAFYDQVNATSSRKRTVRHGDSPYIPTPHLRREIVIEDYDWGDFVDDEDKIRVLNDPTNAYVQAAGMAFGRDMDQALFDGAFGNNRTGEDGSTILAFNPLNAAPTAGVNEGQTIVETGSVGMTLAKLLEAREIFDINNVSRRITRHMALSARQFTDMLNIGEINSIDFNSQRVLVNGSVDAFLGFKYHLVDSDIVPLDTPGGIREVLAWAEDGLTLAVGKDKTARIGERADKGYATYAFMSMTIGASRMQGEKVLKIECSEA